jgi:DNA-binding response OmpR family regulator
MRKVLVADDAEMIKHMLRLTLEAGDYEVSEACDGQDALNEMEKNPDIELIILDIVMPHMDGLEVAKKLRREGNDAPIIFTSSPDNLYFLDSLRNIGRFTTLEKPFNDREIFKAIENIA